MSNKSQKVIQFSYGFISGIVFCVVIVFGFYFYISRHIPDHNDAVEPEVSSQYLSKAINRALFIAEQELEEAGDEYDRWVALSDLAVFSIDVSEVEVAEKHAHELLRLLSKYKNDWNYGNALHKGHIALGRIELKRGNITKSIEHLIKASKTPGSPQLDSFGPNMLLAHELLIKGESEAVIEYLKLCKEFWAMGKGKIEGWIDTIENGGIPNFYTNLIY